MIFWNMPRSTEAAMTIATLSTATAFAAGVTIAHRLALLSMPMLAGDGDRQRESVRMVSEKMDAATEGAIDAAFEAQRFILRSAFGAVSPDDMSAGVMKIGMAAARPAAKRARANAQRLTRPR